ncbi:MAG: hypothetical protein PF445_12415 [Melioribacteraceae bacterium]|jgi:CII-binding regulator of phage lambda lysogenization HflD|nr:hypothetical protein [Melioribacteraceae bacterium]
MKYLAFTLLLFLFSCDFTDDYSQKDIAHLYVDVLIVEETYKTDTDSMQIARDSLYNLHKIDESKYLNALKKYRYDEETWEDFFSLAEIYLDTLKKIEKREVKLK